MKNYTIAIGILSIALFASCKKETNLSVDQNEFAAQSNLKTFGVIADDPALTAKVPMIISSNFLSEKKQVLLVNELLKVNPSQGGPKGDNAPPTVTITSPSNGSSVSPGVTVSIGVSATDNKAVSSLSFSVDGLLQSSTSSSAFTFSWNTTGVASGTHTITATAKDPTGNTGSSSILITVNTVIITTPVSTSVYQIKMPPVTSQGSEGSCAAFAIGYNTRSAEQYYKSNASSYNYADNIVSPEYLFDQTKVDASTCSGSSVYTALEFLKTNGICTWQSMPYSSSNGCSLIPTTSQTTEAANFKINSYAQISTSDITAIKALISANHPLIISFMVDSYFYYAGPGFTWKSFSATIYGRHAVAICGFDDAKHAVKIINSWGTGWGDAGYTWIDYDFLPVLNTIVYTITL